MIGIGIVGLPNVGKSTLFNAITKAGAAEAANYPFCTIEPNVGMVTVPDERIWEIAKLIEPDSTVPATVEFVDIAGLVKGASKGEGLGNQFLANVRQTAAICQVVRCFDDGNVVHVEGSVDPIRDIETINTELILSDLEIVERAHTKYGKMIKGNNKEAKRIYELMDRIKNHLEDSKLLKTLNLTTEETELIKPYNFLTGKKMMYAANVSEEDLNSGNEYVDKLREYAAEHDSEVVIVSAKIESEIAEMEPEDKEMFLDELGVSEPGLNRLIRAGYKLLNLINYFTAGKQEVRAWTIKEGTIAQKSAGEIHTDIEKGFIRAEVANYDDFIRLGGWNGCKEKGVMRLEGKEYIVKDGDLMYFRFNV